MAQGNDLSEGARINVKCRTPVLCSSGILICGSVSKIACRFLSSTTVFTYSSVSPLVVFPTSLEPAKMLPGRLLIAGDFKIHFDTSSNMHAAYFMSEIAGYRQFCLTCFSVQPLSLTHILGRVTDWVRPASPSLPPTPTGTSDVTKSTTTVNPA